MQQLAMDPTILQRLTKYDGRGYHYSMRASRTFLDLAAAGRNAPAFDTRLTANDNSAIQSAFFSMLADPQVSSIMQMAAELFAHMSAIKLTPKRSLESRQGPCGQAALRRTGPGRCGLDDGRIREGDR